MPGSAARANALDHVVVVLAPAPLRRAQVIAAAAGPMLDDRPQVTARLDAEEQVPVHRVGEVRPSWRSGKPVVYVPGDAMNPLSSTLFRVPVR